MSGALDWAGVKGLPWRQRNAAIEAALRACLGRMKAGAVMSTFDLAGIMDPALTKADRGKLAQLLSRMAPYVEPLATHDGETIIRYGRRWKRWQWHEQRKGE